MQNHLKTNFKIMYKWIITITFENLITKVVKI